MQDELSAPRRVASGHLELKTIGDLVGRFHVPAYQRGYRWGDHYRGLWGVFGGYDYLSPQIFRVSTTAISFGTVAQWWLARKIAL